jgi:hypothetical protein
MKSDFLKTENKFILVIPLSLLKPPCAFLGDRKVVRMIEIFKIQTNSRFDSSALDS